MTVLLVVPARCVISPRSTDEWNLYPYPPAAICPPRVSSAAGLHCLRGEHCCSAVFGFWTVGLSPHYEEFGVTIIIQGLMPPSPPLRRPYDSAAHKRRLFEKAQLKRQYAKILKKENASVEHGASTPTLAEASQFHGTRAGSEGEPKPPPSLTKRKHKGADTGDGKRNDREIKEARRERDATPPTMNRSGTRRTPKHRPDPFKEAKVREDQRQRICGEGVQDDIRRPVSCVTQQ